MRTGSNYVDLPLVVSNGCATPVSGLTLVLTVCGIQNLTYAGTENLPAGWTQLGKPNREPSLDGSGCRTLTFLTALSVPGNGSLKAQRTVKSMACTGSGNYRPAATVTTMVSTAGRAARRRG